MTLQRIAPNAVIVEHKGIFRTFINSSFIEMVLWAKSLQYGTN